MRSTLDLIKEAKAEAEDFAQKSKGMSGVFLIVAFEHHSEVIQAQDPEALDKLNGFVESGGNPIGLCGFIVEEVEEQRFLQFYNRVFEENVEQPEAYDLMNRYMGSFEKQLEAQTGLKKIQTGSSNPEQN